MHFIVAVLFTALLATPAAWALDEELYAEVLEQNTVAVNDIASTRVDYAALGNSKKWQALIASLRESDPTELRSRNQELAFWINAYNVLAMDLVQRNYPIDSIRSIGSLFTSVWKKTAGEIGGRPYTLNEIEHEILRPMGDPRIHAAIVCASLSCPPLRREPYRAASLDAQLDDNVRRWLADPRKGSRIERSKRVIYLSPILDWFAEDFGGDVLGFVGAHVSKQDAVWVRTRGSRAEIRYFEYDWRVNDILPGAKQRTQSASRR